MPEIKKKPRGRELKKLFVDEVSVVDEPANEQEFLIIKNTEGSMSDEKKEQVKVKLEGDFITKDDLDKAFKGFGDSILKQIRAGQPVGKMKNVRKQAVGSLIERRREELGMSVEELAAALGISSEDLTAIESGADVELSDELLSRIEEVMGISADEIRALASGDTSTESGEKQEDGGDGEGDAPAEAEEVVADAVAMAEDAKTTDEVLEAVSDAVVSAVEAITDAAPELTPAGE